LKVLLHALAWATDTDQHADLCVLDSKSSIKHKINGLFATDMVLAILALPPPVAAAATHHSEVVLARQCAREDKTALAMVLVSAVWTEFVLAKEISLLLIALVALMVGEVADASSNAHKI